MRFFRGVIDSPSVSGISSVAVNWSPRAVTDHFQLLEESPWTVRSSTCSFVVTAHRLPDGKFIPRSSNAHFYWLSLTPFSYSRLETWITDPVNSKIRSFGTLKMALVTLYTSPETYDVYCLRKRLSRHLWNYRGVQGSPRRGYWKQVLSSYPSERHGNWNLGENTFLHVTIRQFWPLRLEKSMCTRP